MSSVIDMSFMFSGSSFDQDIGSWDVGSVIDMSRLFENSIYFNQDIGNWNVAHVEQMTAMFSGAGSFNQDLRPWCVDQIPFVPINFDTHASNWVLERPLFGTCPGDLDGDGVLDYADAFPNDPSETTDSDGDGVGDNSDAYPTQDNTTVTSMKMVFLTHLIVMIVMKEHRRYKNRS